MMGYGRGLYGYGYDHMLGGGFGGPLMLLFGAFVLFGVALLVAWALRASRGHGHGMMHGMAHGYPTQVPTARPDEASDIARRRLASGEITSEQYSEIMKALGS
jgi:uncharacterized membrane protein